MNIAAGVYMMNAANRVNNNSKRTNKIAVVTGSSKGICGAIVLAFAKSNIYSGIVVNARKRQEAEKR